MVSHYNIKDVNVILKKTFSQKETGVWEIMGMNFQIESRDMKSKGIGVNWQKIRVICCRLCKTFLYQGLKINKSQYTNELQWQFDACIWHMDG